MGTSFNKDSVVVSPPGLETKISTDANKSFILSVKPKYTYIFIYIYLDLKL